MPEIDGDAGSSTPLFPDKKRGVWGQSDTGYGVVGTSAQSSGVQGGSISGIGTVGTSENSTGIVGISRIETGVYGRSDLAGTSPNSDTPQLGGAGVYGENDQLAGIGVRGVAGHADASFGVWGDGGFSGVVGMSDKGTGVYGRSNMFAADPTQGVPGVLGENLQQAGTGVRGEGDGIGVVGQGGSAGVLALGLSSSPPLVARLASDTFGFAGWFLGNVQISGKLTKSGGGFQIEHPLDRANKYLSHSFVESSDMKNIYDGIVTLDSTGQAKVTLPDWFEALNTDFRYQLTPIGTAGPNLYIENEITKNHFRIAGGIDGMKVSWQVTGTRKDDWANAHRIQVEKEKDLKEPDHNLPPQYSKSLNRIDSAPNPGEGARLEIMKSRK